MHNLKLGVLTACAVVLGCSSSSSNANGAGGATAGSGNATGGAAQSGGAAGSAQGGANQGTGGRGTGGSAGGTGGSAGAAHVVHDCSGLAAQGTWEEIQPPLQVLSGAAPCPYGGAFAMNPQDPSMVYLGSCNQGIWKTTDCGGSWVHIDTGKNGDVLDSGRQWTFAIDPTDPNVLYTNSGYGAKSNGAFKSTNGGVDWEQLWPPADSTQANIVQYNFVGQVVMDPVDHHHLLVTFHATCAAPHPQACFGESTDAGATWKMIDGQTGWVGGEGQAAYFLENSHTWLWGSQSNGLWRTSDSGATWTAVTDKQAQGHGAGQMYRAKDGTFYLPVLNGILRSPDGITWTIVPNSGNIMAGCTGNGTKMWASRGFPWDPSTTLYLPFWSASESDGLTWTQMASPKLSNGGELAYDSDHHLLYSSNLGAGFWRVVTQ